MSENRPAIIGREKCGCITYANSAVDDLDHEDAKAFQRIVSRGGEIIRTTAEAAKAMPHFLEWECPHDPKGWEPK